MNLDRIRSSSTVHVSAREERTYGDWALKLVLIRPSANGGKGTASFELMPHDYDSGESLEDREHTASVHVADLDALVSRRPDLRDAINAIASAVAGHVDGEEG
jgi:hypothetical protein